MPKKAAKLAHRKKVSAGAKTAVPPADCCAVCDSLETGKWGIPWRDAAGTWHCLEGVAGKILKSDEGGPFWGNV